MDVLSAPAAPASPEGRAVPVSRPAMPWLPGVPLSPSLAGAVRDAVIFEHCKWDPQVGDVPVLHPAALLLRPAAAAELARLAEAMDREIIAAEATLLASPAALDDLGLPRALRAVLARRFDAPPAPVRVARYDFHHTAAGWRVSEVNSDVPGGYIEALGFASAMAARMPGTTLVGDPVAALVAAFRAVLPARARLGLVHATAYTDDRQVMVFLARHLAAAGLEAVLLAPDQVRWRADRAHTHDGRLLDALFRFYPGEWLPNLGWRSAWRNFVRPGATPQCNPVSALVTQSKRFPLACARLGLRLPTWDSLVPRVLDPRDVPPSDLDAWVLKPALGRVGADIGLAGATPPAELEKIRRAARRRPRHWAAQHRFDALPWSTADGPFFPCLGVYVVNGRAAGVYGRAAARPLIDAQARDVAVLLAPSDFAA